MRFDLLIFDWDGTLVDSEAIIIHSMTSAFSECGLEPPEASATRAIIGLGMREAVDTLMPGLTTGQVDEIIAHYRQAFFATPVPPQPFAGVPSCLAALKREGYRLAVATGKGREGLDMGLLETGMKDLFEITRCASETRSKPHPLMIEQILEMSWVEPANALVIGDTSFDLEMALAAGCPALAVTSGSHDQETLLAHSPVACLNSVLDIPEWLCAHTDKPQNALENIE